MPEWLWVWGANILNRSLRKEALSCKAWSRVTAGKFGPLVGACSILHLEEHMEVIFCIFFDYLVYSWLILCKTNINLLRVLWENPKGRTEEISTVAWELMEETYNLMCCFFFFFKLFRSCVIYVALGAIVVWYWNTIWLVSSYSLTCFLREVICVSRWIIALVFNVHQERLLKSVIF